MLAGGMAELKGGEMFHLFQKGGPIMWPLFFTSVISLAVVLERIFFIINEKRKREPKVVEAILAKVEEGRVDDAIETGEKSQDFVARSLVYGLKHRHQSFSNA